MNLSELRNRIDAIDTKLVKLLNERAVVSLDIGSHKRSTAKGIYAADREKEVLDRIKSMNKGPMSQEAFEAIYREIMSSSLALEKNLRVAYLGSEGSFTHLAATRKFGSQVSYVSCQSILEVFQEVSHDDCDYGVVPIENSVEGAVTHTFDLFVESDLKICSQILLKISHSLMSNEPLEKIRTVYSNPQVFGQCRQWLQQHLSHAGQVGVASTTDAAKKAAKEKGAAAIASSHAAKIYKVPVVRKDIQDIGHNTTRFLVIAKDDVPPTGRDRTSILFSIKDKVGALHAMLTPFARNDINLTKIESRPSKKRAWDYYFFIDLEGHYSDKKVKKAIMDLEDMCKYLKVLGSYPIRD